MANIGDLCWCNDECRKVTKIWKNGILSVVSWESKKSQGVCVETLWDSWANGEYHDY